MIDGRIVKSGGPELADEIERDGYDAVRDEAAEAAAARA
jgi:Fe-S cluster assembly ATPase SufC